MIGQSLDTYPAPVLAWVLRPLLSWLNCLATVSMARCMKGKKEWLDEQRGKRLPLTWRDSVRLLEIFDNIAIKLFYNVIII
jgi:hypothetical protein